MTMIDDDLMRRALTEAADAFDIPHAGAQSILAAADAAEARSSGRGSTGVGEGGAAGSSGDPGTTPFGHIPRAGDGTSGTPDGPGGRAGRSRTVASVRRHRTAALGVAASIVVILAVGFALPGKLPWSRSSSSSSSGVAVQGQAFSAFNPNSAQSALTTIPGFSAGSGAPSSGGNSSAPEDSAYGGTNQQQQLSQSAAPSASSSVKAAGPASPAPSSTAPASAPPGVGQSPAIEKTGSVDLTVPKGRLEPTMSSLTSLVIGVNGFVADTQTDESSGAPTGTITLEIPVASFESVLNSVRQLGKVNSVDTKSTDVTGQVVDLQSRITALQDSLAQYEKILSETNSIGDILNVQSSIDQIQSQIEQLQGQENLINAVTIYSTLAVSVSEAVGPGHPAPVVHTTGLSKAWHSTLHGFAAGFEGVVTIIGPLVFALLCVLAGLVLGRLLWRATRRWLL